MARFLDSARGPMVSLVWGNMLKCLLYLGLVGCLIAPARPASAKPQRVERAGGRTDVAGPRRRAPSDARQQRHARKQSVRPARGRLASRTREGRHCRAPAVRVLRRHSAGVEERLLSLTLCDGSPNPAALASLSLLARPREVPRPSLTELRAYGKRPPGRSQTGRGRDPAYLSERVLRVHPGLALRLQALASQFRGRAIELVSGHRPTARVTSRHHHGRAFDLRVLGVSNERVRDFLRTLEETGVGYYPNSTFVHVDVRDDKGYWVDRSGPGEPADYGPWPPRRKRAARARLSARRGTQAPKAAREAQVKRSTRAAIAEVRRLERAFATRPQRGAMKSKTSPGGASPGHAPGRFDEAGDRMNAQEVARIRADALQALAALSRR